MNQNTLNPSVEQVPLDTWNKGEEVDHRKLNQPVQALRSLTRGVNRPQADPGTRPLLRQFKITAIADEYLSGVEWDGTTAITAVTLIAKPYLLRVFTASWTRDSVTYAKTNSQRRTATSGATTETQEITQKYVVGDVIYAARLIGGGVGVSVSSELLQWIDMNLDGRAWAKIA